jgi:CheY-like chemotaxis protein
MAGRSRRKQKRVVILDPDPRSMEFTAERLRSKGYDAQGTSEKKTAIELIRRLEPDVVVLGVPADSEDAYRALTELRRAAGKKNTRLVALTPTPDDEPEPPLTIAPEVGSRRGGAPPPGRTAERGRSRRGGRQGGRHRPGPARVVPIEPARRSSEGCLGHENRWVSRPVWESGRVVAWVEEFRPWGDEELTA